MIGKVIEYVKGSELPPNMIKKFKIDPESVFKITIEPRDEKKRVKKQTFHSWMTMTFGMVKTHRLPVFYCHAKAKDRHCFFI